LYQISLAIRQLIADPQRIIAIRSRLHPGARVMFFHYQAHTIAAGTVVAFRPTEVEIQDEATRKQRWLPYAAIAHDPQQHTHEPVIHIQARPAVNFQLSGTLGFADKYLLEHVGTVQRVNGKTLSVECDGVRWRVSPQLLRKIINL
jgi:hypothetical protein